MDAFRKKHIIRFVFLELLSLSPVFILLGNIVPPAPIKLHFIGFGLIFLCALFLLMDSSYKVTVFILSVILIVSQFLLNFWDIKNIIDFLFGPFVLLVLFDLLQQNKMPNALLVKYQKRFFYLLWIPVAISTLQYFEILPITFWNATYINYSYRGGMQTPRPNGLLYHGSELSIIICFIAISQFFNKKFLGLIILLLLVFVAYSTYFKAVFACVLALLVLYLALHFLKIQQLVKRVSDKSIGVIATIIGSVFISALLFLMFKSYRLTGYFFDPQLMTGRGSIWNIFTDAIANYSLFNFLVGSGLGSGPELFTTYASAENYYILSIGKPLDVVYDAHNAILSIFVNSGFFGLLAMAGLYFTIFKEAKTWQSNARRNKYLWLLFTLIPLLTIGITIPLFDMAIIWPCLGFLLIKWQNFSYVKVK